MQNTEAEDLNPRSWGDIVEYEGKYESESGLGWYFCETCYEYVSSATSPDSQSEVSKPSSEARTKKSSDERFVATAVYGRKSHPDVKVLRRFRDNTLRSSFLGKMVIKKYYKYGPFWASKVGKYEFSKGIVKAIIEKIVDVIRYANK